jgi:hypothetical protein
MLESSSRLTLPSCCSATETGDMCMTQEALQNRQVVTATPPESGINADHSILQTGCTLITQYIKLCNLCQTQLDNIEQRIALDCMQIIHSNINTIENQIQFKFKILKAPVCTIPYILKRQLHHSVASLWQQLSFPYRTEIRYLTYNIISLIIESILSQTEEVHDPITYRKPKIISSPSILSQVIYRPLSIIDPYIIALQQNYYPIAQDPITTMTDNTEMTNSSNNSPG